MELQIETRDMDGVTVVFCQGKLVLGEEITQFA